MTELLVALVVAVPTAAGLAAWFADDRQATRFAAIGFVTSLVAGLALAARVFIEGPLRAFGGEIFVDPLGAFVLVLVLVVASIALAGSPAHLGL